VIGRRVRNRNAERGDRIVMPRASAYRKPERTGELYGLATIENVHEVRIATTARPDIAIRVAARMTTAEPGGIHGIPLGIIERAVVGSRSGEVVSQRTGRRLQQARVKGRKREGDAIARCAFLSYTTTHLRKRRRERSGMTAVIPTWAGGWQPPQDGVTVGSDRYNEPHRAR
jgi:hypothetical protein